MMNAAHERFFWISGYLATVLVLVMSSPAWAQAEELKPPKSNEALSSPKYLIMGLVLVLLAGVIVVVTLKTKRGHQD